MVRDGEVSEEKPIDSDKLLDAEIIKTNAERNIIKSLVETFGITFKTGTKTKTIIRNINEVSDEDITKSLNPQEVEQTNNLPADRGRTAQLNIIIKRILSKKEQDEKEGGGPKKCIWSGGNWISMLVNLPDQIEFLGPLGLIW
jgi:hypothetical protein